MSGMTNTTLVTVVLPTYNGADYLADAIQSVVDQTYTHWELIIVDSYSTDATPNIVARFAAQDERIRCIQNPKEPGRLPGALNAGFAVATGEYHTWLSDDNLYHPQALERMADFLDTHPAVDLVYTDYTVRYDGERPPEVQRVRGPDFLAEKNVITPSFMYRRAIFDLLGSYRIEYFLAEDYDFWLRAHEHFKLAPLNEDLHVYRFHAGALTSTASRLAIDAAVERVLLDALANLQWTREPFARCRMYLYLAAMAKRRGSRTDRWRYWARAARSAPLVALRRQALETIGDLLGAGTKNGLSRLYRRFKM